MAPARAQHALEIRTTSTAVAEGRHSADAVARGVHPDTYAADRREQDLPQYTRPRHDQTVCYFQRTRSTRYFISMLRAYMRAMPVLTP